jgi:nitrate/nitrite transporter NarK
LQENTGFVFHADEPVVDIAVIQIPINHLLDIGSPESVLPGEMTIIDADEGLNEFGPAYSGRIYGAIFHAGGFGGLCGPYIFAAVKEMTGGFTYALCVAPGIALVGLGPASALKKNE